MNSALHHHGSSLGLKIESRHLDIYGPKPASILLANTAKQLVRPDDHVLDVCTGSGVVGIAVAQRVPVGSMTLSDINVDAISAARENAAKNDVAVDLSLEDLYGRSSKRKFDAILVHPPAVPYAIGSDWGFLAGMRLATDGGPDGTAVVVRAIREAVPHLNQGGQLVLLLPRWCNYRLAHEVLLASFGNFEQVAEEEVAFFPATEGTPQGQSISHLQALARSGVVDIHYRDEKPYSFATVLRAIAP